MSDTNGKLTPSQVEALIRDELATLKINQGKIKLREWEALEEVADKPATPWIGASFPPMWFIRGELWLVLRRKHPTLTYEDLAELDGDLLMEAMGLNEETAEGSDPTPGADAPPSNAPEPTTSPASATSGG